MDSPRGREVDEDGMIDVDKESSMRCSTEAGSLALTLIVKCRSPLP